MSIRPWLTFESGNFNYIHPNSQYCSISKPDLHRLFNDLFNLNKLCIKHFACYWVFQFSLCHN